MSYAHVPKLRWLRTPSAEKTVAQMTIPMIVTTRQIGAECVRTKPTNSRPRSTVSEANWRAGRRRGFANPRSTATTVCVSSPTGCESPG